MLNVVHEKVKLVVTKRGGDGWESSGGGREHRRDLGLAYELLDWLGWNRAGEIGVLTFGGGCASRARGAWRRNGGKGRADAKVFVLKTL